MSRRLRTPHLQWAWALILEQLRGDPAAGMVKFIAAKPLPVGGASKDPDAHWGRGRRALIKGYKLFALWGWVPCRGPGRSGRLTGASQRRRID